MLPRLWRFDGRIGRVAYVVTIVPNLCIALAAAAVTVHASPPLLWGLYAIVTLCAWTGICAQVRRLHDLGHPGWVAIAMLVPLVDIGMAAYSLFRPGEPGANRYGPAPGE
jgi:uncharacterized membrane protein YhaH (DUF805 family)